LSDSSRTTDSELYQRTRHGDRAAFGELVERHKDGLVNYLTRLCGSPELAEDLAQESFLRLYERGGRYSEQGKLQAYLFRIGTNLFRSQMRREQRWRRLGQLFFSTNGNHSHPPRQQERILRHELGHQLAAALLEIPLRYRAPLVLAFVEGWSHRQIAELMRCQEGTVKSRIHRGRRLLRAQLEDYSNGDAA
jgi:RNA polymerase sigma-70 factor (ECF subfamily)